MHSPVVTLNMRVGAEMTVIESLGYEELEVVHGPVVSEEPNSRLRTLGLMAGWTSCGARPGVTGVGATIFDGQGLPLAALAVYGSTGYLLKNIRANHSSLPSVPRRARVLARMRAPDDEILSGWEIEVLTAVARGLANKAIATRLHISEVTVKTHLLHIFDELG